MLSTAVLLALLLVRTRRLIMGIIGTSTNSRLGKALLLGMSIILLAFASAPLSVQAAATSQVNIINGRVDVNKDAVANSDDDLTNVVLTFNDAAIIQVNIIDGKIDINNSGAIAGGDDLRDVDLTVATAGDHRVNDQVDIIN